MTSVVFPMACDDCLICSVYYNYCFSILHQQYLIIISTPRYRYLIAPIFTTTILYCSHYLISLIFFLILMCNFLQFCCLQWHQPFLYMYILIQSPHTPTYAYNQSITPHASITHTHTSITHTTPQFVLQVCLK